MVRGINRAGIFCQCQRLDCAVHAAPAPYSRSGGPFTTMFPAPAPLEEKDTVSIAFVLAAVARLNDAARARVLQAAGIPAELLRGPQSRVTADAFAALWLAVAAAMDDEFFGLDARRLKPGSFNLLCRSLLPASDLGQALRRVLRGFGCLLDDIGAELQ